jgi:chemotaxis protein CheX
MKAEHINPFLTASVLVLESLVQIRPSVGRINLTSPASREDHIWLQIGVVGQLQGAVLFGLNKQVALRIVSAMMGGMLLSELDELGKSAIAELGNMISGNASTILFNEGIHVDISTPSLMEDVKPTSKQALTVPLSIDSIGQLDLHVMIA